MQKLSFLCGVAAILLIGAGCADPNSHVPTAPAGVAASVDKPEIVAEAGYPVLGEEAADLKSVAESSYFGVRSNPFSMLAREYAFNQQQLGERIISESGGWRVDFEEPELKPIEEEAPRPEPIPTWRLSGVLIGNGVTAILDMGGPTVQIRPGMTIPGTDWVVVSIDEDRAVLRRPGAEPNTMVVPLGGPLPNGGGSGSGGGSGGGSNNPSSGAPPGEGGPRLPGNRRS